MSENKIYRAGLIIIGNEILSGRTKDKNLGYIAEKLTEAGIRLSEVRVIPDIEDEVIETVRHLSSKFDYVFTTGGIGPTHDDITSYCVGKAFDAPLEENKDAVAMLADYYPEGQLTQARLRMAQIPVGASLIPNPVSGAPGFQLGNVYVMAGVPRIMQGMCDYVVPTLAGGVPMESITIECKTGESIIAAALGDIDAKYSDIDIGSYPSFKNGFPSVSLVLRATDMTHLTQAVDELRGVLKDMAIEIMNDQ